MRAAEDARRRPGRRDYTEEILPRAEHPGATPLKARLRDRRRGQTEISLIFS